MRPLLLALAATAGLMLSPAAHAEAYVITLQDHQFSPAELVIPADQKVKVTVKNLDNTPAEFESHELKREKVIKGHSEAVVSMGPVAAGSYGYFDDFHPDTKGIIVAQ